MEKMATNKTQNKSPVFKMGQLWQTIDDNIAADEEDTEEEDEVKNTETMKLKREDMSLFGVCPAWDQFYLVVCEYCQQVIKPQALQKHIDLRHSYHKNNSNNQINNSLKVRTDSTNITTNTPSIRRTSSTITTATNITENGSDINDNSIKISDNLVNQLTESDVKLKPCSTDSVVNNSVVDKTVDNCVKRSELSEQNQQTISKMNSKLINLLSPNISTTIEPSVPEPTGPGPGFATVVSADSDSVTISVPEINLSPQLETIKEIEVTVPVVKPAAKKKSYKKSANPRKLLPCKDREYDPNKHCGVCLPDMERPCTRSLTCKTHSLTLRRSVQGRIKNFDELLTEHREAKEAALRAQGIEVKPTKKAIQKQQQQLRASQQLQLKAEENQQLISDKNILSQPLNPINRTTIVFSESQPMVSNITTNSNSLLSFVPPPICPTIERTREPVPTPERSHLKLDQIEVESDGSVYMRCHPKPAAVCNFNIRTLDKCRLLSRNNDLTLAALRSTFNSPLLVSKLTINKKCSSTVSSAPSPIAIKSPLRNANQTFSAKKLRISIDSESLESSSDAVADPYNFADAMTTTTTSANIYTYVKPKTTIAKLATNASKKKKKSDINCTTFNSSLLSNGQLFHSTNTTKTTGNTAKKKSVVNKKNVNNSHSTCISADIPMTNNSVGSDSIDSVVSPYSEQLFDQSTSLISEVPQRNLNDILSNSMDSSKTDNGSILLNGSLLSCNKRNTFSALSKPNIDIKDSINKKTIFAANSLNSNNNRFLINSLSPPLTTISSGLSINANSRPIIQKQSLPSSTLNNNLTQSQNMSQLSQSLHNTHTIFIKSAKQSLQNQLIPTISSPKLLSKAEDYTT